MKDGFDGPLDLRAHTSGEWVVLNTLRYDSLAGRTYGIPAGFVTDLASIPAILRPLFNPNDAGRKAAVLHDSRYCIKSGPRKEADDLFLEALERCGVGYIKRYTMYWGVRSGGWLYWNKRQGLTEQDFAAI
jgi:hypothetical protein